MVMVKGLGVLEVFMNAEEGAILVTDNDLLICCDGDAAAGILYAVEQKGPSCKFLLSLRPSGKVRLQDYRGMFLRCALPTGLRFVEPESPLLDSFCDFEPFFEEEKIALKGGNGMFVCRVYHRFDYLECSQLNPEECCRFRLRLGDLLYPGFEICQLSIGTFHDVYPQQCVVKKDCYVNRTNAPKQHVFTLSWDVRTMQTTTWYRIWGMDCKSTFNFNLLGIHGQVGYNGSYHKRITLKQIIHEEKSATVTVLPNWRATASLIVTKQDDAEIPFVATIRKLKADGNSYILYEKGRWRGLAYDAVVLDIKQEEVKEETKNCAVL